MTARFVVPPTWPSPPAGWVPPQGWQPRAEWGPTPPGWQFLQDDSAAARVAATPPAGTALPALAPAPAPVPRRSWGRRLGWLIVLVGGLVSYFAVNQTMLDTRNVLFFPTVLLIGSVTVPAAVLFLEYAIGQGLDGHGGLIMGTAVLGGVIGVTLAGLLESSLTGNQTQVLLGVAVIEEIAKLLVPLAIFLVARRRTAGAGLALGIAAGAGFAVLETMGYAFYALVSRGGGLAAMQETLQTRALLAPASHIAWTGMVAWALWRLGGAVRKRFALAGLGVAFALAVGLHYLWDLSGDLTSHVVLAVISVAILVTLMLLSARRNKARALSQGPVTDSGAVAPGPQAGWFSPVGALPAPADPSPVSVPDRHAA